MVTDVYSPGAVLCVGGPHDGKWRGVNAASPPPGYQLVRIVGDFTVEFYTHAETHPLRDRERLGDLAVRARDTLAEAKAEYAAEQKRRVAVGNVANREDDDDE